MVGLSLAIASHLGLHFGQAQTSGSIVLNPVKSFSLEEQKVFQDDLAGTRVIKVAGMSETGRLVFWKPNGDFAVLEPGEGLGQEISANRLGILVEYPKDLRSAEGKPKGQVPSIFRSERFGNRVAGTLASENGLTAKVWLFVSKPEVPYFNVEFEAIRTEEMGTFDKAVGSKAVIDGALFRVVKHSSEEATSDWKESLTVERSGGKPSCSYGFFPEVDWDAFEAAFGNSRIRYCMVRDGGEDTQISDKPYKFWKNIMVVRKVSLSGSFSKVSSVPIYIP